MKMKKILLLALSFAVVCLFSISVQAEIEEQTCLAYVSFDDYEPDLIHDSPRIKTVISCNMVLKPRTEAHLSRLCESAVANVMYYFNDSTSDVRKGPDYTNIVEDETFYPASKQIPNSYIGGKVNYKVGCDFQTRKSTGEKIHMEVPVDSYQPVIIISSITKQVNLGVATTASVETGDQSQPNWVGTSGVFPEFDGVLVDWTYDFGYIDDSNISGAFGLFKAKTKNVQIITLKGGLFNSSLNGGQITWPSSGSQSTSLNDEKKAIVLSAKRLHIEYNENEGACEGNNVLIQDGWQELSPEEYVKFSVTEDGNIVYPSFFNAWIRISAVVEVPDEGYRPEKRVRVKSRISNYGGFKFKNLQDGDVVKIYSVNGKKVAELNAGTADGFEWLGKEGTNNSGDWAKSGIYIYQIKLKKESKIISGTVSFVW